ncbi:MAG TPA: hypothetical protein VFU53_07850 [Burkholderiales bacterium]|nr:hypothetical protein [Burkholderiales bacterium]
MTKLSRPGFVVTGQRIEEGLDQLDRLYRLARELCPDEFIAEETRELRALYPHVSIGLIDSLRAQLANKLGLPPEVFSRDRFSIHGCGPVGLHDDFFRFPYVYFVLVVAHCGRLGLVSGEERAVPHRSGDIILLDPRAKHALVPAGLTAEEHPYESTHAPVRDEALQFMFLDFDVRRPDLRARFRKLDYPGASACAGAPLSPCGHKH